MNRKFRIVHGSLAANSFIRRIPHPPITAAVHLSPAAIRLSRLPFAYHGDDGRRPDPAVGSRWLGEILFTFCWRFRLSYPIIIVGARLSRRPQHVPCSGAVLSQHWVREQGTSLI